jgi:hypothetical protein
MTSGNPALTTIAPQARQLTLAGQPVFVGKLKLRQKAALQHWLDALPEPSQRVKDFLVANDVKGWPIGVESLAYLIDVDYDSRFEFLRIALGPFNPGMSAEDIDRLAGDSSNDDELVEIIFAAYGHTRKQAEPADPKGDAATEAAPN